MTIHIGCSERSLAVLNLTMHQFNLIVAIPGKSNETHPQFLFSYANIHGVFSDHDVRLFPNSESRGESTAGTEETIHNAV